MIRPFNRHQAAASYAEGVIPCNLKNMGRLIHFANGQTQQTLMVRMPETMPTPDP